MPHLLSTQADKPFVVRGTNAPTQLVKKVLNYMLGLDSWKPTWCVPRTNGAPERPPFELEMFLVSGLATLGADCLLYA